MPFTNGRQDTSSGGNDASDSKSVLPNEQEQKKGQEMARILEENLIRQNHKQQDLLKQTDPSVYDARDYDTSHVIPSESSNPAHCS